MQFAWSAEQEELRRGLRRFLDEHSGSRAVRAAMDAPRGFDEPTWDRLARDLGLASLVVPEAHGGAGGTWVELVAVMEEAGRALLCAPLLSTVGLAVPVIAALADPDQRTELLGPIAAGRSRATLAMGEAGHRAAPGQDATGGTGVRYRRTDDGFVLSGVARHVLDGDGADLLLIVARAAGGAGTGTDGLAVFAVRSCTFDMYIIDRVTLDRTRRRADVELRDARVPGRAHLAGSAETASALARALDLAAIALAAEQLGGAQRCLDMAVDHARTRVQFGRPIGSFQAIKHTCAELHLRVESARAAVYAAACVASGFAPDPRADALARAASTAKARASEAYFQCAAESLQIHGGTGFTWEHDAHLHLKRARAGLALLGSPSFHRARAARLLGIT